MSHSEEAAAVPRYLDIFERIITRLLLVMMAGVVVLATIELAFVLDRYGGVAFVAVQSASDDRLKEPSLEAARSWRFSPARKDGHPVSVRVVVPVVFPKRSR